jgi:hypothetical protein
LIGSRIKSKLEGFDMTRLTVKLMAVFFLMGALEPIAHAQLQTRKTKVTFSTPVQIPAPTTEAGVMSLPAGSYVFTLRDTQANRHIVVVINERGDKVYSTILTTPDYRVNASSKTVMYFTERAAGAPPAVKSWFYPGDNYGERFVYPKVKAVALAAEVKEPVPATEVKVIEPAAIAAAPIIIVMPTRAETPYTAQAFAATDAKDTAGVDGEPVQIAAAPPLPRTASPVYTAGLIGLLLFAVGLTLRRITAHVR